MMLSGPLERLDLLFRILNAGDGTKDVFRKMQWVAMILGAHDALPDVRCEAQKHENLRNSGARDTLAAGDGGLVGGLSPVELPPPFDGFLERLDNTWDSRGVGWFRPHGPTLALGDGGYDAARWHTALQTPRSEALERRVRSQGDLDRLLVVVFGVDVVEGSVYNPPPDLRDGHPPPVSSTVTFGEP